MGLWMVPVASTDSITAENYWSPLIGGIGQSKYCSVARIPRCFNANIRLTLEITMNLGKDLVVDGLGRIYTLRADAEPEAQGKRKRIDLN